MVARYAKEIRNSNNKTRYSKIEEVGHSKIKEVSYSKSG